MSEDNHIVTKMVEAAGHATQSLGVGRSLGQIYAYVYFTPEPRTLNDMTTDLGISKGSASMGVRQLQQWGALEKIWVKGDRKDYYKAKDNFGKIIKNAILDMAGKRITDYSTLLDDIDSELAEQNNAEESNDKFLSDQVDKLRGFQKKTQGLWDGVMLKMLLK